MLIQPNFTKLSLAGALFLVASHCLSLTQTAMASPQSGGPLVNLPLNHGSGRTATDISGNGLTATLINNATWTTGVSGGAVNLDGNSLLEVPGSGLSSISSQITVAGWVYRSASYGAGKS